MVLHALKIVFLFLFASFGFMLLLWFSSFVLHEISIHITMTIEKFRKLYPDKVDKSNKKIKLTKDKNEHKNGGDI